MLISVPSALALGIAEVPPADVLFLATAALIGAMVSKAHADRAAVTAPPDTVGAGRRSTQ